MPLRPKNWPRLIGIQSDTTSHSEKIISALGGLIGIAAILYITNLFVQGVAGALVVASIGASAVLVFAVPHGPLSQPWPVLGGHVLSAIIGVTTHILIPDIFIAGGIAVGLSIGVMYYTRCVHPPGGATALAAVVSGQPVYALGYAFVITPVLLNVLVILMVAILFNYSFAWRRYPFALVQIKSEKVREQEEAAACRHKDEGVIPRRDIEYALRQMASFADVSEDELEKIYSIAKRHGREQQLQPEDIKLGHYYAHGMYSDNLAVRRIIDESSHENPDKDMVIYKIVAGSGLYKTGTMTRRDFARWAKVEVALFGNVWREQDENNESEAEK